MWDSLIEAAASNGLWALLFVGLLAYLLQDSRKREEKYTKTIENLSNCLETVEEIKIDVKSMLTKVVSTSDKSKSVEAKGKETTKTD